MFGDGAYGVSPLAARDLARILRRETEGTEQGTVLAGGPAVYPYRELTDLLFAALDLPPRYWRLSPAGSLRLVRTMYRLGSRRLYPYEVEWLMSGRLALPPYPRADPPLERLESYVRREADRLRDGGDSRGARGRPSRRGAPGPDASGNATQVGQRPPPTLLETRQHVAHTALPHTRQRLALRPLSITR
jgi:hypothetical protein